MLTQSSAEGSGRCRIRQPKCSAQSQPEEHMDTFEAFKTAQKQGWAHFAPLQMVTTIPAARLVKFAGVRASQHVLDVACGTAGVEVDWREGDAEKLPFGDAAFDVVLSQFGHMFAPRPELAVAEMLRVLKPGGTIAFSTWPPELMTGRMFRLVASYMPPLPPGISPPPQWGEEKIVRERLGSAVRDIAFERATMQAPALSPQHFRTLTERTAGPVIKLIENLTANDPAKLVTFRKEYDALSAEYFHDNFMQQDFLT